MNELGVYNDAVRGYFFEPAHAGDLDDRHELALTAEVSESASGAQFLLAAGVDAGVVTAMAYRVRGCPHLIAALEVLCMRLQGQSVTALEKSVIAGITGELCLPVPKGGLILLLEDALAILREQYAGAVN